MEVKMSNNDSGNKPQKEGYIKSTVSKIIYYSAAAAIVAGVCRLGPIDLPRTVYNNVTGDMPALKARLTDYCREGVQTENVNSEPAEIEKILANKLKVKLDNGKIKPEQASIENLWDATEDYAHSWFDRWIWP
jgi:hypothetical protein